MQIGVDAQIMPAMFTLRLAFTKRPCCSLIPEGIRMFIHLCLTGGNQWGECPSCQVHCFRLSLSFGWFSRFTGLISSNLQSTLKTFLSNILMKLVLESVKSKAACWWIVSNRFYNSHALHRDDDVIRFCLYTFFFGYSAKLIEIISYLMVKTVESLRSVFVCLMVDLTRPGLTAISERWKYTVESFTK